MILVVSSPDDDHAQAVLEVWRQQGVSAVLLDLSTYPRQTRLSIGFERSGMELTLAGPGLDVSLLECRVVWWRRPQPLGLDPDLVDRSSLAFAHEESQAALSGLWRLLDVFWLNDPVRDEEASRKAYQLRVARELGFDIPVTLITNHPDEARAFVRCFGPERTVYKSFTATAQAWLETRILKSVEVELLDTVRFAPVIFQEYIPARADLRVTVVGGEIFSAAIYSQETGYQVDYRMEMDRARVEPFELPPAVCERIRAFLGRLGLAYGAIDLRLTPDGRFVFLEINPAGQWRFIEERTGQPITNAVARLLAEHDCLKAGSSGMPRRKKESGQHRLS